MRVRAMTDAGDMRFGNQQADFLRDSAEAVGQIVTTRLLLWTGEWFLDTTEGTPWATAVLGVRTRQTIEPAIRFRILGTPGVDSLEDFNLSIDPDGRASAVSCAIETSFGPATAGGNP